MAPPRVSPASLRSLKLQPPSRTFCCTRCTAHRALARANLRTRIAALADIRLGRRAIATAPTSASASSAADAIQPLITPATAINRPDGVAPAHRELHSALAALGAEAASFVGVSRLGLALRGLEGARARVAVLAMDGDVGRVRRLVRLLLADPLGREEAWERDLVGGEGDEGGSVLVKYGEESGAIPSGSRVRTIAVPSRTLQQHDLEILVSSLQLETAPSEFGPGNRAHDAILVPGFDAQATSTGRYSHMTYPVHKTLLVGDGLKSLINYGRFTAGSSPQTLPPEMVQLAVQAPAQPRSATTEEGSGEAVLLDVEAGEHALASIRQSISNAISWEHGWFNAGVPPLTSWLLSGTDAVNGKLKPITKRLISSILHDTSSAIASSATAAERAARAATVPDAVRRTILSATAAWSETAHAELRDQLDVAFASRNWAKLKWYKLFWRSDDVTMLLEEIMERRWLPDAEKSAIYLAGRIEGAGLVSPEVEGKLLSEATPVVATTPVEGAGVEATASLETPPDVLGSAGARAQQRRHPYPMHIPLTRTALTSRTIPALQALSQSLVLQTGSLTAITTALSAFAYAGFESVGVFEAGAVLALGIVVALRRLQGKWEDAREYWMGEVREEGRLALKETEDGIKRIVESGGVGRVDEVGVEDRAKASRAVEMVRKALEKV